MAEQRPGVPRLLDLAPMSVARQITVVGHALYSMMEPSELMNLNFAKRMDTKAKLKLMSPSMTLLSD